MPPDDPLGRNGPCLDNFLSKTQVVSNTVPPVCPYGKKCTYGNKCKYSHPERNNHPIRSVTEKMAEQTEIRRKEAIKHAGGDSRGTSPGKRRSHHSSNNLYTSNLIIHVLLYVFVVPHGKNMAAKSLSSNFVLEHKCALMRTHSGKTAGKDLSRTVSLAVGGPGSGIPLSHKTLATASSLGVLSARDPVSNTDEILGSTESPSNFRVTLTSTPTSAFVTQSVNGSEHRTATPCLDTDIDRNMFVSYLGVSSSEHNRSMERLSAPHWQNEEPGSTHSYPAAEGVRQKTKPQVEKQLLSGHVELARKLSDEADNNQYCPRSTSPTCKSTRHLFHLDNKSEVMETENQPLTRKHAILSRQLSLKGSDDPRWKQQQQQLQSNLPYRFHGLQEPIHSGISAKWLQEQAAQKPLQAVQSVPLPQLHSHIQDTQNPYVMKALSSQTVHHQNIPSDYIQVSRMAHTADVHPPGYQHDRLILEAQGHWSQIPGVPPEMWPSHLSNHTQIKKSRHSTTP